MCPTRYLVWIRRAIVLLLLPAVSLACGSGGEEPTEKKAKKRWKISQELRSFLVVTKAYAQRANAPGRIKLLSKNLDDLVPFLYHWSKNPSIHPTESGSLAMAIAHIVQLRSAMNQISVDRAIDLSPVDRALEQLEKTIQSLEGKGKK